MPSGSRKAVGPPGEPRFDAREVEEEIRRNREANERFQREYSEWFERNATRRAGGAKRTTADRRSRP